MTQDRSTNLALLHIEREFVNQVLAEDMERMINTFSSSSAMFIINILTRVHRPSKVDNLLGYSLPISLGPR